MVSGWVVRAAEQENICRAHIPTLVPSETQNRTCSLSYHKECLPSDYILMVAQKLLVVVDRACHLQEPLSCAKVILGGNGSR